MYWGWNENNTVNKTEFPATNLKCIILAWKCKLKCVRFDSTVMKGFQERAILYGNGNFYMFAPLCFPVPRIHCVTTRASTN